MGWGDNERERRRIHLLVVQIDQSSAELDTDREVVDGPFYVFPFKRRSDDIVLKK
jgi:hypothetical protein